MKTDVREKLALPQGVTATIAGSKITVKGPKGELNRAFQVTGVKTVVEGNELVLTATKATKREIRHLYTILSHLRNMIKGVQSPYQYKLKICSGHFPMSVTVAGDVFSVKNFLGEKFPRTLKIKPGVTVKVAGDIITVESADKELAGQLSSNIELLTAKRERDLRRFQDGIYLIEKAGAKVVET